MGQKTTVYWGESPSQMYMSSMLDLLLAGKELAPRGKRIKELRPVVFEFHNPLKRVTFLKGRVINPFFQLAESLWILRGGSDVKSLTPYNASIAQFSDDGEYFNAPYGERLRRWGSNDASKTLINPIDQLKDCYEKLKADPDTRQAVAFIGNPHFDNSEYTLNGGKDIACNISIEFKIREGKLDVSVENRSNDLHWGTFGANLCQFATVQEAMASWLGIEVGTYFQKSDSLHIYLDEYGAKETDKIQKAYRMDNIDTVPTVTEFYTDSEPRFSSNFEQFEVNVNMGFKTIEPILSEESLYDADNSTLFTQVVSIINNCPDEYLRLTYLAMLVKQAHNRRFEAGVVQGMNEMVDCGWKVSCLRFLSKHYKDSKAFSDIYKEYSQETIDYIERKDVV